jgi:hypothetical protein
MPSAATSLKWSSLSEFGVNQLATSPKGQKMQQQYLIEIERMFTKCLISFLQTDLNPLHLLHCGWRWRTDFAIGVSDSFSAMRLQRFRSSNNLDQFSFIFEALIGGNLQGRTTWNNQQPLFCLWDCGRIWRSKSHS